MSIIIRKPIAANPIKHGTIVVQAPGATGYWGTSNYTINDYTTALPTTGTVNAAYSGRFDDINYYTS